MATLVIASEAKQSSVLKSINSLDRHGASRFAMTIFVTFS